MFRSTGVKRNHSLGQLASLAIHLAFAVALVQCGNTPTGNFNPAKPPPPTDPQGGPPPTEGNHVQLFLFSAPWCEGCNKELPEIQERFSKMTADQQKRIEVTVNVTTGWTQTSTATQAVAEEYGKQKNLPFKMLADVKWKTYRKFYEEGHSLPATVILDKDSNIIKVYDPGRLEGPELDAMINTLFANLK